MQAIWQQAITYLFEHQEAVVGFLAALITTVVARNWAGFQALGDWGKRGVVFVAAFIVGAALTAVGREVTFNLIDLLIGGAFSGGSAMAIFRLARTQPTTFSAFEARKYGSVKGNASLKALGLVVLCLAALAVLGACVEQAAAEARPEISVTPPEVEYGCNPSPPNNRCIVTLRDSVGPSNMPVLVTDTVPVGVTRTVAITRTLTAGQVVTVVGAFEGLTATGKKAAAVNARAQGVYDPGASPAVPVIRIVIE